MNVLALATHSWTCWKVAGKTMDARQKNDLAAENLKSLRSQHGLSRDRVIALLNERGISLHVNSLRRIEEGEQPLKLQEVVAFSDIYGLTIDELINSPLAWPETNFAFEKRDGEAKLEDIVDAVWRFAYNLQGINATLHQFSDEYASNSYFRELESNFLPWLTVVREIRQSLKNTGADLSLLDETLTELKANAYGSR
ncbi:helix-turn-helix domain-containing protein [Corynebacterium stationis]|uniref:helix-turn-helix domain-containing protein n=1 Tax=Corynebacterium stationis TaxID=1705 RepID=UPI0012946CD1|nr:helix-turn-helix transcriptional regulator [Corynebacterium stationis]HJG64871.1 helix-turn-helix transcriptional regulator [Corynebacterium stationis]